MARTKQQKRRKKDAGCSDAINSGDGVPAGAAVPVKSEEVDDVRPEETYSNHAQMTGTTALGRVEPDRVRLVPPGELVQVHQGQYGHAAVLPAAAAKYTCWRCDVEKDLSSFSHSAMRKIDKGKTPTCKECANELKEERQQKAFDQRGHLERRCVTCGLSRSGSHYSTSQWNKGEGLSKCTLCLHPTIEQAFEKRGHLERSCAICGLSRSGSHYSSSQWNKGIGQSKCKLCIPTSSERKEWTRLCSECKIIKKGGEFATKQWMAGDAARCISCVEAGMPAKKREKRDARQKSPDARKKTKASHEHEALASNIGPSVGNLIQTPLNADDRGYIQPAHLLSIWSAISKRLVSPNGAERQAQTLEEIRIRGTFKAQEMLASRLATLVYRTTCALKDSSPHELSQLVTALSKVSACVDNSETGGLWTYADLFHSTFVTKGARVVFQKQVVSSVLAVLSRLGDGIEDKSTLISVGCIGEAIVLSGSLVVTPPGDLISLLSFLVNHSRPHRGLFEAAARALECTVPTLAPSALSSLSNVFARARIVPPRLFECILQKSMSDVANFGFGDAINLVESFAVLGLAFDLRNFLALLLAEETIQNAAGGQLASIAWVLALANVDCAIPSSFVSAITRIRLQKGFRDNDLGRIYMWHLWMVHEMKKPGLPPQHVNDFMTGIAQSDNSGENAGLLNDIVMNMTPGLQYMTEVKSNSGIIVDLLVKVNGRTLAVFVENPGHFCGRRPCGSLLLKRRQIQSVDNLELLSIPYYDWINLQNIQAKRQYLSIVLGDNVAGSCRTNDTGGVLGTPLGSEDGKKAGQHSEDASEDSAAGPAMFVIDREPVTECEANQQGVI